ncbi:MAG: pilus assembly protein TadG-related protein [Pseudomonadota bacterium]
MTRQGGIYLIMFALSLLFIMGLCGFALDISRVYNRKAELQSIADAVALAAARELNGTLAGVTNAETKAGLVVAQLRYKYSSTPIPWSGNALRVSSSATASASGWFSVSSAKAFPAGLMFAQVDTAALDPELGRVDTILLRVLPNAPLSGDLTATAVAGRVGINVTPLAVCAITDAVEESVGQPPASPVVQELVQYGFRRGAAYDLMNLGSNGALPAHFAVDAGDPLGTRDGAVNVTAASLAPFTCNGSMLASSLVGANIAVASPFPIATLFKHLNTRFGVYTDTGCTSLESPPDSNIKPHLTSATFNPIWSYAKAIPYSSYTNQGAVEPTAGYNAFPATSATWSALYPSQSPYPGASGKVSYPATTPYLTTSDLTNFYQSAGAALAPSKQHRRVLNVPLLRCPLSTSGSITANVLAIGRFYMTVPATAGSVQVEFAGLMRDQNIDSEVELIQ